MESLQEFNEHGLSGPEQSAPLCCNNTLKGNGPLTTAALQTIEAFFKTHGHNPSQRMWEALAAILQTMEAMADGRASRSIYVSSLEPGAGKSTAMLAFLKAMLASPDHDGVS